MSLRVLTGNVLNASESTLLLGVDGMTGALESSITRAFARKHPTAWASLSGQIRYPIPRGTSRLYRLAENSQFSDILVASTLGHLDTLTKSESESVVEQAMTSALIQAERHGINSIAATILSGGWRLTTTEAFGAMLSALRARPQKRPLVVSIYLLRDKELKELASSFLSVSREFQFNKGVYEWSPNRLDRLSDT